MVKKNLKIFLLDKISKKEFQADSEFYILFGKIKKLS